jgi:hypothetical protein
MVGPGGAAVAPTTGSSDEPVAFSSAERFGSICPFFPVLKTSSNTSAYIQVAFKRLGGGASFRPCHELRTQLRTQNSAMKRGRDDQRELVTDA